MAWFHKKARVNYTCVSGWRKVLVVVVRGDLSGLRHVGLRPDDDGILMSSFDSSKNLYVAQACSLLFFSTIFHLVHFNLTPLFCFVFRIVELERRNIILNTSLYDILVVYNHT